MRKMGSPVNIAGLAPQILGLQADGTRMERSDEKGVTEKQPPVGTDWHSVSISDSSGPEVEYRFKLVERKDGADTGSYLFGSKNDSQQTRKLELSLCGLSKYVNCNGNGDETKMSYPDGLKRDCSPYITMETRDSSNGMKEVRVSFHGLEDSMKVGSKTVSCHSGNHDLGYGDDGCLSFVSQFRAFFSTPKISCGGLLNGDSKRSLLDGLSAVVHSSRTSDSSPTVDSKGDSNTETGNQPDQKMAPSVGLMKTSGVGCKESPKGGILEAKDLHARCDAFPLAHYRPDCPVWCSKDQEQQRNGACSPTPNSNTNSPVNMNCKKPPKPPKPPRHPGRSTSLDAATLAAKAAAARRKALKQAAAKRKARISATANSGGTPVIALLLTIGFGLLMVFQGLFVQSTATNGDSERTFVDVPSNQFGELSAEKANSYGLPYSDSGVQSSSQVVDRVEADMVISNAFYKSMQEIESSRISHWSDPTVASG